MNKGPENVRPGMTGSSPGRRVFLASAGTLVAGIALAQLAKVETVFAADCVPAPPLQNGEMVNVLDHGAKGDGQSNDRLAIQQALDAAIAARLPLFFPPGAFYVAFEPAQSSLRVAGDVVVVGSGPGTTIRFGPESPSFIYNGFEVELGVNAVIHNLTLQGPTNAGPNGKTNIQTAGVFYAGPQPATPENYAGSLTLRQVQITGNFFTACMVSSGANLPKHGSVAVEIRDCDFTAYTQAVCVFTDASGYSRKRLHAYSSIFHDGKLADFGHLVYIHPSVAIHFENCRFAGIGKYSIHHYGSVTQTVEYARILRCMFDATSGGVLTSKGGLTEVRSCTFKGRSGVVAQSDTVVDECIFDVPAAIGTFGSGTGDRQVMVTNCQFTGTHQNRIVFEWSGGTLIIRGGHWTTTFANADHIHPEVPCSLTVDNCRFNMPNASRAIWCNAGRTVVRNSTFEGKLLVGAISIAGAAAEYAGKLELLVEGCEFLHDGRAFHINLPGGGAVTNLIRANECIFRSTRGIIYAEAGVGYQMMSPKRLPATSPVASVSTTNLDPNSDTVHISGNAAIQTITLGGYAYLWGGARINLIADSAWALGTLGNIVPKQTAARTPGETVSLLYDGGSDKWREL